MDVQTHGDGQVTVVALHGIQARTPHAARLADGLPNARLVMIEGAGHRLLTQVSARVACAIGDFIADSGQTGR